MTPRDPPKDSHSQKSRNVLRELSLQRGDLRLERNEKFPPRGAHTILIAETQVQRVPITTQRVSNVVEKSRDMFDVRRNTGSALQIRKLAKNRAKTFGKRQALA